VAVIRIAASVAAACLAASWACGGGSAFSCTEDAQCRDGTALGVCEASGYCSFVDDTCESGRRYGSLAPQGFAEVCVQPVDATTGTAGDDATADAASETTEDTAGSSSATMPSTTLPVDPGSTGETLDESTTGPPGSTSSSTDAVEDGSSSSSTGPAAPPCEVAFFDEFDNGVDPEWGTWSDPDSYFAMDTGTLLLSIAPSSIEWVSAGLYTQEHSFLGGHVRVELLPFAAPIDVVGVWLTMFTAENCEVQIAVESSGVTGHSAGVWFDPLPIDSEQPIWLQLRLEPDGYLHWEVSTNAGDTWTEVHGEAAPCDFSAARSAIFAGGMHDGPSSIIREVEWYERCEAP
jgi:hypothetical protein